MSNASDGWTRHAIGVLASPGEADLPAIIPLQEEWPAAGATPLDVAALLVWCCRPGRPMQQGTTGFILRFLMRRCMCLPPRTIRYGPTLAERQPEGNPRGLSVDGTVEACYAVLDERLGMGSVEARVRPHEVPVDAAVQASGRGQELAERRG